MSVLTVATLVLEVLAVVWFLVVLGLYVRIQRRIEELHRRLGD